MQDASAQGGRTSETDHALQGEFFIIGGASKAATTSAFFYLAAHPQICQSNMKETRFFLDLDYPVDSKYRFTDGLDSYLQYFKHCAGPEVVRLEATPDYLYSAGTAERMHRALPGATVCFILREPVSRLISWYRYALARGLIPAGMSLDAYVRQQQNASVQAAREAPQALRSLEQGRYSGYLKPYLETFAEDRVCILLYDELVQNPRQAMAAICEMIGIEPGFYEGYAFDIHNQSQPVRSSGLHHAYVTLRSQLRRRTHDHKRLHGALKQVRRQVDGFYAPINVKSSSQQPTIDAGTLAILQDYYAGEIHDLGQLLGKDLSYWVEAARQTGTPSASQIREA